MPLVGTLKGYVRRSKREGAVDCRPLNKASLIVPLLLHLHLRNEATAHQPFGLVQIWAVKTKSSHPFDSGYSNESCLKSYHLDNCLWWPSIHVAF